MATSRQTNVANRDAKTAQVIEELKRIYKTKILPLEQYYRYDIFSSPNMSDAEFDAKPQVMLVGQYSVGKTSFIRYLLNRDFPGQRIGPEPTTDCFTAVMNGTEERIIPGNALAVQQDLPYRGLEKFGVSFLNRLQGACVPSDVLKNITLVDTPGVLSGEKQRVARGYDFCKVISWFASRADLILLLFDAHKLDISDEFKNTIEALRGNDDKIRCVLNKADQVDRQRLMRIYGALMWSLGKVVPTPEVLRVYIGSFWDQPYVCEDNAPLFEKEKEDLLRDLKDLPRNSAVRKINELCKRVRLCKVHAYIISYLKEQMPMLTGHKKKQQELITNIQGVFRSVMKKYNLAPGDFPEINDFGSKLQEQDFSKFHSLKEKLIEQAEGVLFSDIPRLMEELPQSLDQSSASTYALASAGSPLQFEKLVIGGAPSAPTYPVAELVANPWDNSPNVVSANPWDEPPAPPKQPKWSLQDSLVKFKPQFDAVSSNGLVSGAAAKPVLSASGLPNDVLKRVWALSDVDRDNNLNIYEFVIAMHLCESIARGSPCPAQLDSSMLPPK